MSNTYSFVSFYGEKLFHSDDYKIIESFRLENCPTIKDAVLYLLNHEELFLDWIGDFPYAIYSYLIDDDGDSEEIDMGKFYNDTKNKYISNTDLFIENINKTWESVHVYTYAILNPNEQLYKILALKDCIEETRSKVIKL